MKTRSSPSKKAAPTTTTAPAVPPLVEDKDPPVMVLLPEHDRANSRLLSLENPRTGELNKYFFDPALGVFEFKKITPPSDTHRSILTVYDSPAPDGLSGVDPKNEQSSSDGYITKTAFTLVATPIDPIWLVLPVLSPSRNDAGPKIASSKRLFQPIDDLSDTIPETSIDLRYFLNEESFRETLAASMESVCETVDAGDKKLYRLSEEKLFRKIIAIAKQFAGNTLPSSMEDYFVRRALERPVLAVKRNDSSAKVDVDTPESQPNADSQSSISISTPSTLESQSTMESQSSFSTTTTTISTPATELSSFTSTTSASEPTETDAPDNIVKLLRIRTALQFILASYIPLHISTKVNTYISSPKSPIDFTPLNTHLADLASLRAEALASRSMGDFSRKRTLDDEGAESREEKKRRLAEEERKKKLGESKGVRDLKKVNTTGMKKMGDFFKKAASKAKA
jgi:hypothetical protein